MHLWLRGSTFWFSLRVPRRHVATYGATPIRVRLGRLGTVEARRRACLLAAHADVGMEMGMEKDTLMRSLAALSAEIAAVRREAFSAGVRALPGKLSETEMEDLPELAAADEAARRIHAERRDTLRSIVQRLDLIGRALDEDGIAWEAERRAYERAVASAATAAAEVKAAVPVPAAVPEAPSDGAVTRDTLLSVAAVPVVEARCEALSSGGTNRYADHVRHSLRTFLEVVGDKPLGRYVPADLQEYANVMSRVPSNLAKLRQFRGMGLREAAEANARMKSPKPCMGVATIDKYLTEVRHIWQRATASVTDIRDIGAASVTMPRNAAPAVDREGLPAAAVTKWLADAASHREPHFRWLPVLGLLTGMRLSELVFLQPGDFVEFEGQQCIDLRRFVASGRPLKTKTSRRVVPVHPVLHEIGFMDWVREPKGRWLFPAFHEAADPADAAQKRMAHWMKGIGIHSRMTATFHSLRHSAKAWLRGAVGDRIADLMQGHAMSTVGATYGFRLLQADEIARIVAAPPPRGVDFTPYASDPGRRLRPSPRRKPIPEG